MYLVVGNTVVRIVGAYDSPDVAEAVAARLNEPEPELPLLPPERPLRAPFRVDL
jgi:hypothetical protein